jgi:hypothetical protein
MFRKYCRYISDIPDTMLKYAMTRTSYIHYNSPRLNQLPFFSFHIAINPLKPSG